MKKKLFIVAVCIILVLSGVSIGLLIHAEETVPELNIAKCTLSLKSNIYIVYAVQGDLSSDVRLLIWNKPHSSYEKGTEDTVLTPAGTFDLEGTESLRFEYTKLAAKQMGDVVYARAVVEKNGQYYYSDVRQYSILQYIYEKTGRTGDEPYPDDDLIKLLNSMIVYGADAQRYFKYKTDRMVDEDHYWIQVEGGTLGDLCTDGLYIQGDQITLIAPETDESGKVFASWTDGSGKVVGTSATTNITVGEANESYTANYTEPASPIPESQGLAYVDNGDGTCTITGIGECEDTVIYLPRIINGLTVKAVGEEAFKDNTSITYVYMPDSISLIDKKAFYGCTELGEVTLPGDTQSTAASGIQNFFPTINAEIKAINTGKKSALNTKAGGAGTRGETGEELVIGEAAFQNCTSLESITIPDTVTSIGNSAFQFCSSLTNVSIPESVTTIGESAFQECTNLESIILPDGITTIGESAFYGCSSLKSMEIPEGTTTICSYAFWGCDFERVVIPSTVTQIERGAFAGCDKIAELVVSENNPIYYSVDNCIIHRGTKSLIIGCKGSTIPSDGSIRSISGAAFEGNEYITSIVIPEGIVEITDAAFAGCKNLTTIELPESLVLIGDYAFGSSRITTITIPDAVTRLGHSAFGSCEMLETVIFGCGIEEIGANAFKWCHSLSSISIPGSVISIGDEAFEGCANLESIMLEEGVRNIGESAFYECRELTSVAIPKTVSSIGKTAFGRCDGIETITIDSDNPYYVFTNNCLIEIASKKVLQGFRDFVIPDDGSVEIIEEGAFAGNSSVVEIIIPSSVVSIGNGAFADCKNLAYVTVPDSVTVIGSDAFSWCSALVSINIPSSLNSIMNGTFFGCESLTEISIPEGVTDLGYTSFGDCINLAEIQLPRSVSFIGSRSFDGCQKLVTIYYSGTVEEWDAIEKGRDFDVGSGYYTVYASDGECKKTNLFAYRDNGDGTCAITDLISVIETDSAFEIPSQIKGLTVVSIDSMGGMRFGSIAGVIIPDTVQRIGEGAFGHFTGLNSIVIPDSVSYIGDGAFSMCLDLSDVLIGKGVTYIGQGAFTDCPLESITVSEDNPCYFSSGNCVVETDSKKLIVAGMNCVIPADGNVTTICEGAFSGVMRRRAEENTIVIPSCVTTIEREAFHGCELANIVISNGVTSIGISAFDWTELHRIIIPSSVTQLGDSAFAGNWHLYSAILCEGITEKGINIFNGCDELKKIYFWGSVENWNEFARTEEFSSGSPEVICGITEYNNSFFVLKDNTYSFIATNGNANEFEIASTVNDVAVSEIEDYAFLYNIDLHSLTIPESIQAIGCLAFKGCIQLEDIYYSGTARQWCSIAFGDDWDVDTGEYRVHCSDMVLNKGDECGLTYVINNDNEWDPKISITGSLFSDISQLVIPKSIGQKTVTEIADGAFEGYAALTTVIIPDTVELIGNGAFEGCAALTSVTIAGSSSHFLSIGDDAFKGCGLLSSVTLPGSVNSIGESAFENCISLSEIILPFRISVISESTFAGCSELQSITVYSLVKSISENAFNGCIALSSVCYDGSSTDWEQVTIESGNDILDSASISFGRFYGSPIASAEDFYSMTNDVYYLVNDLSLTGTKDSFGGILNGNGHTISLNNDPAFYWLENAMISNLTIRGKVSSGETRLGALACRAYNVIVYNVINYANIVYFDESTPFIGGIIGSIETSDATEDNRQIDYFIDCINHGNIVLNMCENTPRIGGIVGNAARWQWCVYDNCKNYGYLEVNVDNDSVSPYVGGIAGSAFGADFINCENCGELRSQNAAYMGGIIARPSPSCNGGSQTVTCTGCINSGDIYCSTNDLIEGGTAGGIMGHAGAKDSNKNTFAVYACINCVNNGKIICGGNYVGGIIGYAYGIDKVDNDQETNYQYAFIEGCTNNGNITGTKTVEQNESGSNWEATFVSQFLGYANTCSNVITNSQGYGNLINTNNNYNVIFGISSDPDCVANTVLYGIILLENEGTVNFNWCSGNKEANRISLEDYLAIEGNEGKIVFVEVPQE